MQLKMNQWALGASLAALVLISGCANIGTSDKTLYQRLGGQSAIVAVVDDFVANIAADKRINQQFANTNIPRLKQLLVEQICAGTGGPCTYTGRDMKSAHTGRNISEKDFNALVEDLVKTLDKFSVPAREKNELLGILGPMKGDIINR